MYMCVGGGGEVMFVCVGSVGDGESAMAVKSLGTGHGGRTRRKRRCVERS